MTTKTKKKTTTEYRKMRKEYDERIEKEFTEELIQEAGDAVENALEVVLFHHFGQRSYLDLDRKEQDIWEGLSDKLKAEIL